MLRNSLKVNVVLYEYIGYGLVKDIEKPSEQGCYDSANSVMHYLVSNKKIKYSDIIVYGTSMGAAIACYLAKKYIKIGGLIMESPFKSCISVFNSHTNEIFHSISTDNIFN